MASKKIEFELILQTQAADGAVLKAEKRLVSLSSNLKESLNKLEVFKKLLESTGDKFPALEALKRFKDELDKAKRSVNSLKDEETKKFLKEFLAQAGKTSLPAKLSNALQPPSKQGTPFPIQDLNKANKAALEKIYQRALEDAFPHLKNIKPSENLSKKLQAELDKALKNTSLTLSQLGVKPAAKPSIDAQLQTSWLKILGEKMAAFSQRVPVSPWQDPRQRAADAFQGQFSPYKSFKGLAALSGSALTSGNTSKDRTEAAYGKYKPLTYVQKETERLAALQKQLETIPQNSRLAPFWAETAKHIQEARLALAEYVKVSNSLKFQAGLNNAVLPYGQKQLSKAQFEVNNPKVLGNLGSRADAELQRAIAQAEKRFNTLLQNTAAKIDGTTDKAQRALLLNRMKELGSSAQKSLGNIKLGGEVNKLTSGLKDELYSLKESLSLRTAIQKKEQEIVNLQNRISTAGLSSKASNSMLKELLKAKAALQEIDSLQKKLQSNTNKTSAISDFGSRALGEVENRQKLAMAESRYGSNSLQAINLAEQQRLAALRAKSEAAIQKVSSSLTPQSSSADRVAAANKIKSLASAYDNSSRSIISQTNALRENTLSQLANMRASSNLLVRISEYVIGYRAVNAALDTMSNFIRNIPDAGIKFENVHAIFKAMFVTQKDITEQFSFLDAVAERTGGRLKSLRQEYADYSASAKAAGESNQNIQDSFAALADVTTVLHLPEDKVHGALVAISQMYAKNQVMAEELKRQLGNVLPGVVAMFARSQGMSTKELMAQMKLGNIRPKDTVPQFLKFYKQVFAPDDAFEQAAKGFYATLGRYQNEYTKLTEDIYKVSSKSLTGIVSAGTSGLKLVRENLDGILTVVTAIAATATLAGGAALFSGGRTLLAKKAIGLRNAENAANPALGSLFSKRLNAENPADLASMSTLAILIPTAISTIKNAIVGLNPYLKGAILLVGGLSAAWHTITSSPDIDLGDKLKVSRLQVVQDRLSDTWQWLKRIADLQPANAVEALAGAIYKVVSMPVKGWGLILSTSWNAITEAASGNLSDQEKLRYRQKAELEKREQDYKTFRDNLLQESKKQLLEEPALNLENMFDSKSFTRIIELVGRSVASQITIITQIADAKLAQIEMRSSRLDKLASRGLLAPGQVYEQRIKAIQERLQVKVDLAGTKGVLNNQVINAERTFSEKNDLLEAYSQKLEQAKDAQRELILLATGQGKLTVKGVDQTYNNLGYTVATDKNSPNYLSETALAAKDKIVLQAREAYLRDLQANQEENPGTRAFFLNKPLRVTDKDIKATQDLVDKSTQSYIKFTEALQKAAAASNDVLLGKSSSSEPTAKPETKVDLSKLPEKAFTDTKTAVDYNKQVGELFNKSSTTLNNQIGLNTKANAALTSTIGKLETGGLKGSAKDNALSPAGAVGRMQIMPDTARKPGYGVPSIFAFAAKYKVPYQNESDSELKKLLKNSKVNEAFGTAYSQAMVNKYGLKNGLAAYNAGPGAVEKYNGVPPWSETQAYVKNGLSSMAQQMNMDTNALMSAISSSPDLGKAQVTGVAMASSGLRAKEAIIATEGEKVIAYQTASIELENAKTDFQLSMSDFAKSLLEQVNIPLAALENPRSFESQNQSLIQQFKQLENTLKAEKQITNKDYRSLSDSEIAKAEQAIRLFFKLNEEAFYREQRASFREQQNRSFEIAGQQMQNRFDFQIASQVEQAASQGAFAKQQLAMKEAGRSSYIFDQIKDPNLSFEAQQNNIKEYDMQIAKLRQDAEALSNFFTGTLSSAMQAPIKEFILGSKGAFDTLKAIGYNFLDSIAINIIQSFSNQLAKLAIEAATQMATKAGLSALMSSFSFAVKDGGNIPGFASGGKVQTFSKSQRISGPGTSRSDSIDAIVPIGSYILNAEASRRVKLSDSEIYISPTDVKSIGLNKLDSINSGGAYAEGGFVGNSSRGNSPSWSNSTPGVGMSNVYNISVEVSSSGDSKKDGETIGFAIMEAIAKKTATEITSKAMQTHVKHKHSGKQS